MKNLCIVCGARPNFIKVAPLIRTIDAKEEDANKVSYRLVFTGAADDSTVESSLFDELGIRRPDVCLGVTATNLSEITGQVMQKFETYLHDNPTDTVIVVDDLASTMAVAIVTKKHGIRLAHIAAGTRSFDINMPKEVNRLVIDGLSDILFTAGASNTSIVNREGGDLTKVYMVGNILIDNLRYIQTKTPEYYNTPSGAYGNHKVQTSNIKFQTYLVFTLNRKVIIANDEKVQQMVKAIIRNAGTMPVIAPLRGKAAEVVNLCLTDDDKRKFHVVDPLSYLEFEHLTANAAGIITDSGNVAEEATFNHVPCITLNSYTEHIETVKVGTNCLVGEDPKLLGEKVNDIVSHQWKEGELPERWDGRTAERILNILEG